MASELGSLEVRNTRNDLLKGKVFVTLPNNWFAL